MVVGIVHAMTRHVYVLEKHVRTGTDEGWHGTGGGIGVIVYTMVILIVVIMLILVGDYRVQMIFPDDDVDEMIFNGVVNRMMTTNWTCSGSWDAVEETLE